MISAEVINRPGLLPAGVMGRVEFRGLPCYSLSVVERCIW